MLTLDCISLAICRNHHGDHTIESAESDNILKAHHLAHHLVLPSLFHQRFCLRNASYIWCDGFMSCEPNVIQQQQGTRTP